MSLVPAKVAGVKRVVACSSPGQEKRINPAILYTMVKIGADEIYCLGGAQAIAAMAYGYSGPWVSIFWPDRVNAW
jgi:histidinol dehydrogenase